MLVVTRTCEDFCLENIDLSIPVVTFQGAPQLALPPLSYLPCGSITCSVIYSGETLAGDISFHLQPLGPWRFSQCYPWQSQSGRRGPAPWNISGGIWMSAFSQGG